MRRVSLSQVCYSYPNTCCLERNTQRSLSASQALASSPALDPEGLALADSFSTVQQCAAHWHVTAEGAVRTTRRYKVNAGASSLLHRDRGRADLAGPPVLVTNIAVPSLHSRKRSIYFLPDRILIRDGRRYADMPYAHCRITGTPTRFIENGSVPRDAERVGTTWK